MFQHCTGVMFLTLYNCQRRLYLAIHHHFCSIIIKNQQAFLKSFFFPLNSPVNTNMNFYWIKKILIIFFQLCNPLNFLQYISLSKPFSAMTVNGKQRTYFFKYNSTLTWNDILKACSLFLVIREIEGRRRRKGIVCIVT